MEGNEQGKNIELGLVEKAESLVKQLDEQNKRYEELVQRQEKAKIESMLAGRSSSDQTPVKQKRELTPKEAAAQFGKTFNLTDPMPLVDV